MATSRMTSGPPGPNAGAQHARTLSRGTSAMSNARSGSRSQESGGRGTGPNGRSGSPRASSTSTQSNVTAWLRDFGLDSETNLTLGEWGAWLVTPAGGTGPVLLTWDMAPARPMSAAIAGHRAFSRDDLLSGRFSVTAIASGWNGQPAHYALREHEDQRTPSAGRSVNATQQGRTGTSSTFTNTRGRSAQVTMKVRLFVRN